MSTKISKIVVLGGGSAGWMTASTLIKQLKNTEIVVIESPNVPTVGVGESTIGGINNWMNLIGIQAKDFMEETDASYKLSIRFTDFYRKGSGSFHYPFGVPFLQNNFEGKNDWYYKKVFYPETPVSDYAECMYPNMAMVTENRVSDQVQIPGFIFARDTAYHFDAAKFGAWLKTNVCLPNGVTHISADVVNVDVNQDGIERLKLDSGEFVYADMFIDCTGFKSMLLGSALNEPFVPFAEMLPNNSAWATRIPYTDKESQLEPFTDCHAIENGWVWNIPLWSRLGTGYVYSDKYVSDEEALEEFKRHLKTKGHTTDGLEFKNIKMRVGIHERVWVKNVAAIGLSAGFIEPLESNGLFTVHEFLMKLVRVLNRGGYVSQLDKDVYNSACSTQFKKFADFVAMHYAYSHRDDTEYWRDVGRRSYTIDSLQTKLHDDSTFTTAVNERFINMQYLNNYSGLHCVLTGLNVFPQDEQTVTAYSFPQGHDFKQFFDPIIKRLNDRKETWKNQVKSLPTFYEFMQKIYEKT